MKISVLLELLTADFETDSKRAAKLFDQSVGAMTDAAKKAGATIGAGLAAGVTAMAALGQQAIGVADQLAEASARTGASVEELSKLKYAAEQSGASLGAIQQGLQKLSKEADAGGKNLARLGISVTDSNGQVRQTSELFLDAADKIARMGNATERSAAAQAIFGKAGVALLPVLQEGREGIKALGDEAESLGVVFSTSTADAAAAFNDNLDKLKTAALGLGNDIAQEVLPALLDLTNAAIDFIKQIRDDGTLKAWVEGFKEAITYIDDLAVFIGVRLALGALPALTTAFGAATGATRLFSVALAAAGGPVGLLLTGVAALAVAIYNQEDALDNARDANIALIKATNLLKDAQGYGIKPMLEAAVAAQKEAQAKLDLAAADLAAAEARAELSRQVAESLRQGPRGEPGAQAAVGGAALAYELANARASELRQTIDDLRSSISDSNEKIKDAEARLREYEESLKDAGEGNVTLGETAANAAEREKELGEQVKRTAEEWKRGAELAMSSQQALLAMLDRQAVQLGGPTVAAAIEYRDSLVSIHQWEEALLALGPITQENMERLRIARENAAKLYSQQLEDIAAQEEEASGRALEQANEVEQIWSSAYDQMSYLFGDALTGQLDSFDDFADALTDIWMRALADMVAAEIRANLGGNGSVSGGAGSSSGGFGGLINGLFGGLFGGGAASSAGLQTGGPAGSNGGLLGSLFGGSSGGGTALSSSGGSGGFAGGGGGIGGGASGFGFGNAVGWVQGLNGIRTGNVGQGVLGGAAAGMQWGPWGAIIGAIIGGLGAAFNKPKPPDFRLGGSAANVRKPEGDFDTVFGNVRAGSRLISWESLVEPIQNFDIAMRDLVMSIGGGEEQLSAIRDALSRWSVDLKDDAATAENVLGSRFNAILGTFSQDVQDFVGTIGTTQERVSRLTDALAIEAAVEAGALGDTFDGVADLLEDYRQGSESLGDTYSRVLGAVSLLDEALTLSGVSLEGTRDEVIRFAADIAEAAGGLDNARALWGAYFETFYSPQERALTALNMTRDNASAAFTAIGLNSEDFAGEGGMAAFRALFEQMLPTLSAEATVQWLQAAAALGLLNDATEQYASTIGVVADNLGDFMASINAQLEDTAPELSIAERIAEQQAANDALLSRAIELGASEEQIASVRELGQRRLNVLLEEQARVTAEVAEALERQQQAAMDLDAFLGNLAATADQGVTPFTSSLQDLNEQYRANVDTIERLAREAGRAGASTEELNVAVASYRAGLRALIQDLVNTAAGLVSRLYGQRASSATSVSSSAGSTWMGPSEIQAIGEVEDAVEDRYAREMQLLEALGDYVESLNLSNLSPLTPQQRLMEARANYEDLLARAQGGDLDALEGLQQASQEYLSELQSFTGGVGGYASIFSQVRDALAALVARGPLNQPLPGDGGSGTGISGTGIVDGTIVEAGDSFAELSAEERAALSLELAAVLRDLMAASGRSFAEVTEQLGVDVRQFVSDLGVDLSQLTVETATQLVDISRTLGIDMADLTTSVGLNLGDLADRQSLLNDALEQTVNALPPDIRDQLRDYLTAIENSVTAADANAAIDNMEEAINAMSPEVATLLAPFFANVSGPTEDLLGVTVGMADNIGGLLEIANAIFDVINTEPPPDPELPPPDPLVSVASKSTLERGGEEIAALKKAVAEGNAKMAAVLSEIAETNRSMNNKLAQMAVGGRRM